MNSMHICTLWTYVLHFVIRKAYKRQSNTLDKYIKRALNDLPLLVADFKFSSIHTRQSCALNPS